MASPQFSVRIPPELDAQVKQFAEENCLTKTKVMIDALAHYLGCASDMPMSRRMLEIEHRVAVLETAIKKISDC